MNNIKESEYSHLSHGFIKKWFHSLKRDQQDNIQYYILMFIPIIMMFIFGYIPLFGNVIAFQNYSAGRPFLGNGVEWVGLKWFKEFLSSYYFPRILRNTIFINLLCLLLGFWVPIIFALAVNEIRNSTFKKFTQTVSYMPNFVSAVVVAGMVLSFIDSDGIITSMLTALGVNAKSLNANPRAFPWIYTLTLIWKTFGWSSILYLSTISSIDPGLYEAADVDGASRMKKIRYITLPEMVPLIVIQLIMAIGNMLGSNTEMILLMYNSSVLSTADVIGTYIYRESLLSGKYSYGTACGLIMSVLSFALLFTANQICRKHTDYSMW